MSDRIRIEQGSVVVPSIPITDEDRARMPVQTNVTMMDRFCAGVAEFHTFTGVRPIYAVMGVHQYCTLCIELAERTDYEAEAQTEEINGIKLVVIGNRMPLTFAASPNAQVGIEVSGVQR